MMIPILSEVKIETNDDKVANNVKVFEKEEEEDIQAVLSPFSDFLPKFIHTQLF